MVEYQVAVEPELAPNDEQIQQWMSGLEEIEATASGDMTVRVVDELEMQALNQSYRDQNKTTNVLSFPADWPAEAGESYLGDIALCAQVINREAQEQAKPELAHWAHMLVHGVLHLLGFNHQNESDATKMEARERAILQQLGYPDPYLTNQDRDAALNNTNSNI